MPPAAAALARDGDELTMKTLFAAQRLPKLASFVFIERHRCRFLENSVSERGYLDARQMASAFQLLRSNDLIWSRMMHPSNGRAGAHVRSYGLEHGNNWTCSRMHSTYLRRLFLNNELAEGHFTIGGRPVSLGYPGPHLCRQHLAGISLRGGSL